MSGRAIHITLTLKSPPVVRVEPESEDKIKEVRAVGEYLAYMLSGLKSRRKTWNRFWTLFFRTAQWCLLTWLDFRGWPWSPRLSRWLDRLDKALDLHSEENHETDSQCG